MIGTWFPVSHAVLTHPKAHRAGAEAMWLAVCSWGWSDLHATDGLVPHEVLPTLAPGLGSARAHRAAGRLVEAGLWHADGPDFRIHDYHDHQDEGPAVRARRAQAAARKRQQRERERNGGGPRGRA